MTEPRAEAWCDAWEAEATRQGIERGMSDYWKLGTYWIWLRRYGGRSPTDPG
jgi:hypothetical protein